MVTKTLAAARVCLLVLSGLMWSGVVTADVLLYRGEHVYLVPKVMGDRMLQVAPAPDWHHYPDFNRRIDSDGDGRDDFISIAIGAQGGHGVQIRYRLEQGTTSRERIGSWYWAVMTDTSGDRVVEHFNN